MHPVLPSLLAAACLFASCTKGKEAAAPDPIPNNKALTWTKTYGGTNYEFANSVTQLQGGDYVIAGTTRSIDGDIGGSRGGYDAWLAKMDGAGNKVWGVTFGENDDDYGTAVVSTPDGGFLVTGYTFIDYRNYAWAIKTNASGVQQWKKSLSESTDAKPLALMANDDGTYIIAGYTSATDRDGWIAKLDANGNALWNKHFGGSAEDQFSAVVKSADGGYILTGFTASRDGDMQSGKGNFDGWVLKVDGSGSKRWSMNTGGSDEDYLKSIIQLTDGNYLVAGYTKSTDGDIPQNKGGFDEWLIKIDGSGQKQWTKTYGGRNEEYITTAVRTADGGFMTIGYTNSTTYDVLRVNNDFGGWLLKMDASGNKTAASTYGERYDDFPNTLIKTQDGGYMIAGYCYVEGRGYDAWLVKVANF